MAAGTTVEELILQDVEAALSGINGAPTFNNSIRYTRRQDGDPSKIQAWPAAIMVHNGFVPDGEDGEGEWVNAVTRNLQLLVYGAVNSKSDKTWPKQLETLSSDLETALRADVSRGGRARFTSIGEKNVFDQTEMGGSGIAAVELRVLVTFRHVWNDTTQAL